MSAAKINPPDILAYWFGELDAGGRPVSPRHRLWFGFCAEDDEAMRARFGGAIRRALSGGLEKWRQTPEESLAYIILLDQMTRAVFRNTAAAFSGDARAFSACKNGIAWGDDLRLPAVHCMFFYMPLQHGENAAAQETSIQKFSELHARFPEADLENARSFAGHHREIIQTFGRFPHRNAVLGRNSTAAELAYLQKHGGGFGQGAAKK
ncbi:MAG: DUF924 domain-containing protein [Betaproteobacteria bacterium]|nr:DUF924 domain-containing protein [Betaproteobacteria bacterium]